MKWGKGQATRSCLLVLHQFGHLAILLLLFVLILFGLFGFRLSQGPITIPQLAARLTLRGEGIEIRPEKAELAWAGYHKGGAVPLVLRLTGLEVRTQAGHVVASVPLAILSLPMADIFGGRKPFLLTGEGATFPESNVPVSWYANLWPGAGFTLSHGTVFVNIGAGHIGTGDDRIALQQAAFELAVLPDGSVQVLDGSALLARQGQSAPQLTFSFRGRYEHEWRGVLHVAINKVEVQDLAAIWPAPLMPNTRHWVTTHIIAGQAQNGRFVFGITARDDLSHLHLSTVQGGFDARDLTLIWLKGAPDVLHMNGQFIMQARSRALIRATSGEMAGIMLEGGTMQLRNLDQKAPNGLLDLDLSGSMQTVLAVLEAPPLNLLGTTPAEVKAANGTAQAHLQALIPFKKDLNRHEVHVDVRAHLSNVSMPTPFAGLRLTDGQVALQADGQTVLLQAVAKLAGSPVRISFRQALDGNTHPATLQMTGLVNAALWHASRLDVPFLSLFQGQAPFTLTIRGDPEALQHGQINVDLTPVTLALPLLGWSKAKAAPGQLHANFTLLGQKFGTLQTFTMQAPALSILAHSQGDVMMVPQAQIGRNRLEGTLTIPTTPDGVWVLQGNGAVLDLHLHNLHVGHPASLADTMSEGATRMRWRAVLSFAKVYLANPPAAPLDNAKLVVAGTGYRLTHALFTAASMHATVTSISATQRQLVMQGDNAGSLLSSLGLYKGMRGGVLSLQARFVGTTAQGVLTLDNARLIHAPGFMVVLQAATLYGLAEALSGPGLLLNHTAIPFSLSQGVLTLTGAESYSDALGFTASGTVDIDHDTCNLETTIIPAYALNAFLGRLPLIGHLFTAERGGGLFAMRAHVQGKLQNPQVSVNPFSMLTPGFLRGIFGLGQAPASH